MTTTAEELHDICPGPGCTPVRGPDVYRADAHPITCDWMMHVARRCNPHDELLRPDEADCPAPDVDDWWHDPHNRTNCREHQP